MSRVLSGWSAFRWGSAALLVAATTTSAQTIRQRELEKRLEKVGKVIERNVETGMDQLVRINVEHVINRELGRALSQDINGIINSSIRDAVRALEETGVALERRQDNSDRRRNREPRQNQDWDPGTNRIDTTFAFSRDGTVDLTAFNGDITVTGWDRNEARVQARSERGSLRGRFTRSRISVEADMTRGRSDGVYEVTVPRGVRVVIRSMSGDVVVRGVRGPVNAHTNNGDVTVMDAAERIDIGSLSGDIVGSGLRGSVDANSLNGEVRLTDVEGRSVQAESTSGDIVLLDVRSPDIDVSTVSGEVGFTGTFEKGGTYSFTSHSGEVTLRVPADISARFGIETFSGSLDSDFPVTLQPNRERRSGRRLEFTVGAGEARVVAESFSGLITIRRDRRQ